MKFVLNLNIDYFSKSKKNVVFGLGHVPILSFLVFKLKFLGHFWFNFLKLVALVKVLAKVNNFFQNFSFFV